jgi:hypothetical protein
LPRRVRRGAAAVVQMGYSLTYSLPSVLAVLVRKPAKLPVFEPRSALPQGDVPEAGVGRAYLRAIVARLPGTKPAVQ